MFDERISAHYYCRLRLAGSADGEILDRAALKGVEQHLVLRWEVRRGHIMPGLLGKGSCLTIR
jgi:hypothetical protein